MSKPIKVGPFFGINNKMPSSSLRTAQSGSGVPRTGNYLRDAVNVDLTTVGSLQRRPGATMRITGGRCRSLWSDGTRAFYADGAQLYAFDGATARAIADLNSAEATVSYAVTPRGIVWTDGASLQVIAEGVSTPLCVPALNPVPTVSSSSGGGVPEGTYQVAFANVNTTGERSAISECVTVAVPAKGTINLAFSGLRQFDTRVFVSAVGGSILYFEALVSAETYSFRIPLLKTSGEPMNDWVESPMPPGQLVRYYRGRLLTVADDTVFFSLPFAYGHFRASTNYVRLDAPITLCEPSKNGIFLATAKQTWFLSGDDIADAALVHLANYGAVPNTAASEPSSLALWWFSSRGAVRAVGDKIELRQDEHIAFGDATNGASIFRESNGLSQLVSVLSNATPALGARASAYMTAEVINT